MKTATELIFLHEIAAPCHLAILAESIGLKTQVYNRLSDALQTQHTEQCIFLVPQQGGSLDNKGMPTVVAKLIAIAPVALYQVKRGSIEAESALLLGLRGLLYTDQGMDLLMTGLKRMAEGELWFERPLISRAFERLVQNNDADNGHSQQETLSMWQALTQRERSIIQLVSSGARNKEIAHRLCISEHTVKAHISSIFRKTQSRNRVELLRWSQNYHCHFSTA
ncbi:response regulator transcription factor [Shewanella gelidii]|uniref:Helix-turn-helix transcriptional regulator n=1 Tax=Shewanella gelidii TaxID=1642821 RepID=A0A917JRJ5_9GAMM|nr:LuxR C-terminal-related transcriptional regulator [Shewanella gelidii]MCL1098426.1 LuxR C-terminal-related transcriptional regulator [Shewanella gelidii]GGI82796.1 helix-turn-helix transcriptional regulator [Shewanella gelidii]